MSNRRILRHRVTIAHWSRVTELVRTLAQEALDDSVLKEEIAQTPGSGGLAETLWNDALGYVFRLLCGFPPSSFHKKSLRVTCSRIEQLTAICRPEDAGDVYEMLLGLAPGIAQEPMCRLRRGELEVVVPKARAAAYARRETRRSPKIAWVEDIPAGTFYLRRGLGRKTTGSYYSPPEFVEYLIRQTLESRVLECSPSMDPHPVGILSLKVLDPAMGAGHFLIEACRFLGEQLYDAYVRCDELASKSENEGDFIRAKKLRQRILEFRHETGEPGPISPSACKRAIAKSSLYGVDIDPRAVDLARFLVLREASLGIEAMDALALHLVCGNALTEPVFDGLAGGFDAIVGNPPWERLLPADREFFAAYDLGVIDASRKQNAKTAAALRKRPDVALAHATYVEGFRQIERIVARMYHFQDAVAFGRRTTGKLDAYRLFMERAAMLVSNTGRIGLVVPSGFHTNEGATGIRKLYIKILQLCECFSFENQRRIFDIHASFKFDLVVAKCRTGPPAPFSCAFYLHDPAWLRDKPRALQYSEEFVEKTTGEHLALLELRAPQDLEVAEVCFGADGRVGALRNRLALKLGRELNMTDDAWRFLSLKGVRKDIGAYALLHEGKTFHQYDDRWDGSPRFVVACSELRDKPKVLQAVQYYRLAFRAVARSTDDRTAIFALVPPGVVFGNSGFCEREPWRRKTADALVLLAVANSFSFDWVLRQRASANVNMFILDGCPLPASVFERPHIATFLAHAALRLTCNHIAFASLWIEVFGSAIWRESVPAFVWPAIGANDSRWTLRARMDALVARAYGLGRAHYAHVLASFRHKAYAQAPEMCLAAFDELAEKGIEAFVRQHDPYWDVPLPEKLGVAVSDWPWLRGQSKTAKKKR